MTRNTLLVTMALSTMFLAGCYGSGVDRNWGRASRVNHTAQVRHPDAPESLDQSGLDALSGEQAMAGHRQRAIDKVGQQQAPSVANIGSGIGED